jgi:protein involved in polysaccharide export with SLBB domain
MPDPDAPESHPTPDAAVTVSVTPATSVTEPAAKVATVPQATNAAPDWHMGGMKPVIPTVQPDSVLWISVAEDPSLNGRYLVNNSSAIDFGYVGMVFLPDMTVEQAEKTIKTVLEGRYLTAAAVTVRIAKASYDVVGVMGSVQTPGEIKIGPGVAVSVSEVLRRAGGLKNERERLQVKIIRGGLRTPFGPAAEGEVYPLSSSDGRLRAPEVFLRNNDLAYVFAQQSGAAGGGGKRIILLGEVPRRGVIDFAESEPCTLMYLLFKIGGLPRFAKADRIKIVRRAKNGKETTFTVDGGLLMDKGDPSDDLVLESGDRVIVPARKIAFF